MRIVSWNIRAGGGKRHHGIYQQIVEWNPDVVALSEFRGTPASQNLAHLLHQTGWCYQVQTIDEDHRATNALLTASKYPVERLNIPDQPRSPQRWLALRINHQQSLVLVNMHIPNAASGYKYPYYESVLQVVKNWDLGPAILIGDTNSGKQVDMNGGIWKREQAWMEAIENQGWVDAYRDLYPKGRDCSWYSHKNNGFRLDQAFCSPDCFPMCQGITYAWGASSNNTHRREELSDHAAIILDLNSELDDLN